MAFGSFDRKNASAPMAEINMVPLIDVVLVLLVIFIVTAPLLTNVVKLDLPKATSAADIQKPEKIEFAPTRMCPIAMSPRPWPTPPRAACPRWPSSANRHANGSAMSTPRVRSHRDRRSGNGGRLENRRPL